MLCVLNVITEHHQQYQLVLIILFQAVLKRRRRFVIHLYNQVIFFSTILHPLFCQHWNLGESKNWLFKNDLIFKYNKYTCILQLYSNVNNLIDKSVFKVQGSNLAKQCGMLDTYFPSVPWLFINNTVAHCRQLCCLWMSHHLSCSALCVSVCLRIPS